MKNNSKTFSKFIFIFIIFILLLILNGIIKNKSHDRKYSSDDAHNNIATAAGGAFNIKKCYLYIPYEQYTNITNSEGSKKLNVSKGNEKIYFDYMNIDADIYSEDRQLGIYSFPVFYGEIKLEGEVSVHDIKDSENIHYFLDEAAICMDISDKSLQCKPVFTINNQNYDAFFLSDYTDLDSQSICSKIKIENNSINHFSTTLKIRGADDFVYHISSSETTLNIHSDCVTPGFSNYEYLPINYNITDEGFDGSWYIPFDVGDGTNTVGFSYIQPLNLYRLVERAINYGFLFIIVPFIVLFLFEIFANVNLHPIHYLLSGAASVLFFMLLLSISEHIKFNLAYLIAAVASGLLISVYVCCITKKNKLGVFMSIIFFLLYGYLFICLQSEDYALLLGSIFAFIVLAIIMFVTRNVNWANLKKNKDIDLIKE